MSDSFIKTLNIESYDFDEAGLKKMERNAFVRQTWPVTYIISDSGKDLAYVGESTNALSRMKNHLKSDQKKPLKRLHLITSDKFNKSSTLDIESNLIKYMSADGKFKLLNGNAGLTNHSYYQRDVYSNLFKSIWAGLIDKNLALHSLVQIDNSDLFKYSPYKSLTIDQHEAVIKIIKTLLHNEKEHVIVQGGAGTGKTILAVYLIKLLYSKEVNQLDANNEELGEYALIRQLNQIKSDLKIALVVPMTSLRKTLKKVFKHVNGLSASMVIGPSEVTKSDFDLLIVDEAHRLHRRVGITNYGSFDKNCEKLGLNKYKTTELDWIKMQSKQQILFYDHEQSIRPSDITQTDFNELLNSNKSESIKLSSQLRVKGGLDFISFVDHMLSGKPNQSRNSNNLENYEFEIFTSFKELVKKINEKNEAHGLCRLIAGYAWPWKSRGGKEESDIVLDGLKMKWNTTDKDWINSKNAINEIGCIHTTQGYDLNYVGVIFGSEIGYNPIKQEILIHPENYFDTKGKVSIEQPDDLKNYILNIYKTMMLRGILGCYIYVVDDDLREFFASQVQQ